MKKAADIRNRPRGRGLPDWWVVEKTPDWRPPHATFVEEKAPAKRLPEWVLVDGAPLPGQDGQGGAGPGMKIGAGGKPQGYDSQGRYTGPRGGSVSLLDGSVSTFGTDGRLYANGQVDDEEQREAADGPFLTDILLADSGRAATDAGGASPAPHAIRPAFLFREGGPFVGGQAAASLSTALSRRPLVHPPLRWYMLA